MKRTLEDNISRDGSLNNDKILRALLEYRNTPLPDIDLSPAQILFHRQLRDSIPTHRSQYHLHKDWVVAADERERIYAERNKVVELKYNQHTRPLTELSVGTHVLIQGQNKKWEKQGVIVEKLANRQYRIKVHGSGRVTLQNRRFIRPCHTATPTIPPHQPTSSANIQHKVPVEYNITQEALTPTWVNDPNSSSVRNSDHGPSTNGIHQEPSQRRVPRALSNLATYNNPGRNEQLENAGGRRGRR